MTKKIISALCKIIKNNQKKLYLGNLYAKRDWGHAKDYVEGMWRILQHNVADDFVLATGHTTSIRDFVIEAFHVVKIKINFSGEVG